MVQKSNDPEFSLCYSLELHILINNRNILLLRRIKLIYPWLLILLAIGDSLVSYWVIFGAPSPKITIFGPEFRLFCSLELHIMKKKTIKEFFYFVEPNLSIHNYSFCWPYGNSLVSYWVIFGAPAQKWWFLAPNSAFFVQKSKNIIFRRFCWFEGYTIYGMLMGKW